MPFFQASRVYHTICSNGLRYNCDLVLVLTLSLGFSWQFGRVSGMSQRAGFVILVAGSEITNLLVGVGRVP